AALFSTRWRRQPQMSPVGLRVSRVRRALIALLVFGGLYPAVEVAPLPDRLEGFLAGTIYVLGALATASLLIHVGTLLITSSLLRVPADERGRVEREYVPLADKLATFAIGLMAAVVVAKHFGSDLSSLLAALGVGSLAIGLAAQQTLGNMIAGFVLLV